MNRFTRRIKGRVVNPMQVIILAAGVGSRTRSYEPRCLLKYGNKTILENQLNIFQNKFNNVEISVVCGFDTPKMIRKIGKKARIIENTNYEHTNNGESLRLAINNSLLDNIIFLHADLIISEAMFDKVSFDKSFIFVDSNNKFDEKEVGVTVVNGKANILSHSLPTKWCQIAYLAQNEVAILRKILLKPEIDSKVLLTFEILNKIIEHGGSFEAYEIGNHFIKEIDTLKDITNENGSR
jgi:hypothetical protein